MRAVRVLGAGPAGCAAAIAALREGAAVELFEQSRLPRHKVCGEFLSPGVAPLLERLGAWGDIQRAQPARIERFILHLGAHEKSCRLPEPAYGLSRYALDQLLFERALRSGATARRERAAAAPGDVVATGREGAAPRGRRLFGFKAHFRGPGTDAVELFFSAGAYVGVSAVEDGKTNVCGLASERLLSAHGFDLDSVVNAAAPLALRLRTLERVMEWMVTGPVTFGRRLREPGSVYRAGDALGFIDPFTGSGILNALATGRLAGLTAARQQPVEAYLREARRALGGPFGMAALMRRVLESGWAGLLAPLAPARWLFRLTRPAASGVRSSP